MKPNEHLRWGWRRGAGAAAAIALSSAAACGSGDAGSSEEIEPGTFVAFDSNFRGFHEWEAFAAETDDEVPSSPHLAGHRTAYLNHRPPSGSTSYPVGTVIVKEIINDDPTKSDVVARVKRGGTFNARGASGWEWFELRTTTTGSWTIWWRGIAPPSGESYLGNVEGGCNACHTGGDDVSILMPTLRLTSF